MCPVKQQVLVLEFRPIFRLFKLGIATNSMRTRNLLIAFFVSLSFLTFAQTTKDSQSVIQLSIDLPELQPYYHVNEAEGRKPLMILNDGIVQDFLSLTKFGERVQFRLEEDLFFNKIKGFLDFDIFSINPEKAHVIFHYSIEGIEVDLMFANRNNEWYVTKKEIVEQ